MSFAGLLMVVTLCLGCTVASATETPNVTLWEHGQPRAGVILPENDQPGAQMAARTLDYFLQAFYEIRLPVILSPEAAGACLVLGTTATNPVLAQLVLNGLKLTDQDLGSEGFQIITHLDGASRYVVLYGHTPVALKHACQDLIFYHLPATAATGEVEWPLNVVRRPEMTYRGIYTLPCWAAHDSLESWERVLRFDSELTLNRVWFWLNGFPVLPAYGGRYAGTALADPTNVKSLIRLCREEGMKFYFGGGWFMWHHDWDHAQGDMQRGLQYYLDAVKAFPEVEGIYLEPCGEATEASAEVWPKQVEMLDRLVKTIHQDRPEFEFAIAIGRNNTPEYRQAVHAIDTEHLYWWWCWGHPVNNQVLGQHPLMLRWHTLPHYGLGAPPTMAEKDLTGCSTSYDPGMGFGNSWTGWGKLGVDNPRDFHPYSMPYFSHEYYFREHCWDLDISDQEFAARLGRRLFDADMPPASIQQYLRLEQLCYADIAADASQIEEIDTFVKAHAEQGTRRNRDTLARMAEAVAGLQHQQITP